MTTFMHGQTDAFGIPSSKQGGHDYALAIHQLVQAYADYGEFNGAVLAAHDGNVVYVNSFGLADFEAAIPNHHSHAFRLASVSKQFTSMLVMQLVASGQLDLHSPISTYLPDYPRAVADKVTLHHLLCHSSGIPSYTNFDSYRDMMNDTYTPAQLIATFSDSSLRFEPGQRYEYSNSGYALLGYIMEKVTGMSYAQLLDTHIFAPLGMQHSGYYSDETTGIQVVKGYNNQFGMPANPIDMSVAYAAGGIYSTVEDLFIWDQTLYTDSLLPTEYRDQLFNKHIPAWGNHYGYGWEIGPTKIGNGGKELESIQHDGVINGFTSIIVRIPETKSSVILLNNTGSAPLRQLTKSILGILHDEPFHQPKPTIAQFMYNHIEQDGLASATAAYEAIKSDDSFRMDEGKMNELGYHYLEKEELTNAEAIFKLNLERFPTSGNAHDSYAEALLKLGRKDEAIASYQKSLYYDPRNFNGIEQLKQLGIDIDEKDLYYVPTPENWQTEIFTFPLRFAPDIPFTGKEEAHFPRNWRNIDHDEFWSYFYVWNINDTTHWTAENVSSYLSTYFDGLMHVVNRDKTVDLPKTIGKFTSTGISAFSGTLDIYDAFVTNEIMTLHAKVNQYICPNNESSTVFFMFSPKPSDHAIWQEMVEYIPSTFQCN